MNSDTAARSFAEAMYDMMMEAGAHAQNHRLAHAAGVRDGLAVSFEDGHQATIAWSAVTPPSGSAVVSYVRHTTVAATLQSAEGIELTIGADVLHQLASPGGRARFEAGLRARRHVVNEAVVVLRKNLGISTREVARRAGLPAAKMAEVEAGLAVSEWDLHRIAVALDAHLPHIFAIQELLTGPLAHLRTKR